MAEASFKGRTVSRYFRTREDCYRFVRARLTKLVGQHKRVFVGWDFAFGYPKGLASALRLTPRKPWKRVWKHLNKAVVDKGDNCNNRFTVGGSMNQRITGGSGPFWGVPAGQSGIFLGARKDFGFPVRSRRIKLAERRLVEQRHPKMQSPWKLAYAGSVGGQSILGIPKIYRLAFCEPKLKAISKIWPFQTKFADRLPLQAPYVLHAEIYPSSIPRPGKDRIPDREQVRTYVQWLKKQQEDGRLRHHLSGPGDLTDKERRRVLRHEGWVFGVA